MTGDGGTAPGGVGAGSGFGVAALAAAGEVLTAAVRDGVVPGAVAAVGTGPDLLRCWVSGSAQLGSVQSGSVQSGSVQSGSVPRPMARDTVFDLASLTKVAVTTPLVLALVGSGAVALADPVARFLPGVHPGLTVAGALTHTAGLRASRDYSAQVTSAADLVAAAAAEPLVREPGTAVEYSDLGFILLGGLVERVCSAPLDVVAAPVHCAIGSGLHFRPPHAEWARVAATEVRPGQDGVARAVVGEVHDENAAAAGGVAGHAGAFGTVEDVAAVASAWLADEIAGGAGWPGSAGWPGPAVRQRAVRDATVGLGGHRGLGWAARGDRFDVLSGGWGPRAVSHTGFTGTSLALDPVTRRWAVLLTNAVHLGRGRAGVPALRRAFHAALLPAT